MKFLEQHCSICHSIRLHLWQWQLLIAWSDHDRWVCCQHDCETEAQFILALTCILGEPIRGQQLRVRRLRPAVRMHFHGCLV